MSPYLFMPPRLTSYMKQIHGRVELDPTEGAKRTGFQSRLQYSLNKSAVCVILRLYYGPLSHILKIIK